MNPRVTVSVLGGFYAFDLAVQLLSTECCKGTQYPVFKAMDGKILKMGLKRRIDR
jgi:hypothetical protein